MTQQGDVQSRLRFDTRQFTTGTAAAERRLEAFGEAGVRVFERLTAVAQGFQNVASGLKLPEIRPNVTINLRDSGVTGYTAAVDTASVSTTMFDAEIEQLGNTAQSVRPKLEGAGQGAEVLGRGSNSAVGGVDRLHDAVDRLQQVGALLLSGAGLFTYFRRLDSAAGAQQAATTNLNLYNRELVKANETGAAGQRVLDELAGRFKINSSAIAGDAAGILRYGANLEQTSEILLRAGASAVIRRRAFTDGANAANEALNGEYSAALNLIGVSGNLSTYFQRMAKEQKTTVDLLTRQQKVEAFLNLLRAETGTELEAVSELYVDYAAALQRVNTSQLTATQDTGSVVIPTLTTLKNIYADLLDLYSALPRPLQALVVGTATLGVVTGALVVGYVSLRALLFNQRTLGPVILDVLKNESVARGRLGGIILAQAQAYNLLSKSQLKQAEASVAGATANATAATGAGRLAAILRTPIRGGVLLGFGALVGIAREATNYLGVLKPVVDGVLKSFEGTGIEKFVTGLQGAVAGGQLFVAAFQQSVLYTVTALSLAFEELSFQYDRSMLVAFKWGQQARLDGAGAADTQRRIDALATSHEANKNAILDSASAYNQQITNSYLAATGLREYASSTELAADGTRKLTAEAEALRDRFKGRLADLKPEVDTSTLKGQITQATEELDSLIKDLRAEIENLPLGDVLRGQLEGFLQEAQNARKEQVGRVYAAALVEAEEEAADATLGAMRQGAARVEEERDRELQRARKAFEDRTALLKRGSERYNQFLELYDDQRAAINRRADGELRADAESRLETARGLKEQLDQVAAELRSSQAEGSGDALTQIRVRYAQNAQAVKNDTASFLREVEAARQEGQISDEQAAADTLRRSDLQTAQLAQNQAELTRETERELQRRKNVVEDYYSVIRGYEAAYTAEQQRNGGDDVGAVQTELAERLRVIDQGLRRELQAEGLTRGEVVAITRRAEADRVQARVEAGRQIEGLMRDEASRERALQNELRGIRQQGVIDAAQSEGSGRGAAAAEYAKQTSDLRSALNEELAAVGLSEGEKEDVRTLYRARREAADTAYGRKLAGFAEAEAEVVAAAAASAERARVDALGGSLPRLIAQFGLEQRARLESDAEELKTFEGTQAQRQKIVARNGQREASNAKGLAGQILREQKAALTAYADAVREAEAKALALREEASRNALAAAQKVTDFGSGSGLSRDALRGEQVAYEALNLTLENAVRRSGEVAASARARAQSAVATAADVGALVAAEDALLAAQGKVVDATSAQLDRYRQLQAAQQDIVRGGSDVLAFADAASKITGADPDRAGVTSFIREQQDALVGVLRQQERNNVPLREQLTTLQEIAGLEERLKEAGETGLGAGDRRFIDERQAELLRSYPADAAKALSASADVSRQIRELTGELSTAQERFAALLGQVSGSSVLELSVRFDDREVRQDAQDAQEALAGVFGERAAARISERFAKGFAVDDIIRTEMAATSKAVRAQLEAAGSASGRAFIATFAEGIAGSGDLVERALENVLRPVRELLPSSDAKRGPLSDLTYSGGKTVTTYAGGFAAKLPDLTRVVARMATAARPLLSVSGSMTLPGFAGAGAGGGGDQHIFNFPDIYAADDLTRMDMRRAGDSLMRYAKGRLKTGYRPPLRGGQRF